MLLKKRTDWNLLAKSLAGETNEKETRAIIDWLKQSPENRALYKQIKSDWKMMDSMNKQFNVDNAWNKLHSRIIANESPLMKTDNFVMRERPHRFLLTPVRIAASIMLLALIGWSVLFFTNRMQTAYVTATIGERGKTVTLTDGSSVFLNGSSSIRYPKNFNHKIREVTLEGEAFFEVSPDKSKPFMIHANTANIKVLGTSFNVDASGDDRQVEVYVSTGLVEFSDADDVSNKVLLKAGTIGLMHHNEITSRKAENANSIAWKTGIMTFHDTRLSEVTPVLDKFL